MENWVRNADLRVWMGNKTGREEQTGCVKDLQQ